ncbi:MAG: HlyD family efflux transporter periplasmic adaptor subunit [Chitinophagaceae bacterium]|nr:HlyD family efflux transporter periplasmic adaptor subunit [Chitinophagaceae bacterium]
MKRLFLLLSAASLLSFSACNRKQTEVDASGSFEAIETIISAEAGGKIRQFSLEEGQSLQAGQQVGYIDSVQLYLKKKQLESQVHAVLDKKPDVPVQLSSLQEQLKAAEKEEQRMSRLVQADAATGKQLDDVKAQVAVIRQQIAAQRSALEITANGIGQDAQPLKVQIEQVNEQLAQCNIINPSAGTVLIKYAEVNEVTAPGKALYKIADLSTLILRVYISGDQLPLVRLNQKVQVLSDNGKGGFTQAEGTITQISDKAEFTPKTIQTKDERANLVYAVKVKVANDGTYKIGMYGAIKFK